MCAEVKHKQPGISRLRQTPRARKVCARGADRAGSAFLAAVVAVNINRQPELERSPFGEKSSVAAGECERIRVYNEPPRRMGWKEAHNGPVQCFIACC